MVLNWDLILLFVFGLVLLSIMLLNKKRVQLEKILFPLFYLVLYRTQFGLKFMDKMAKRFPKLVRIFAISGIIIGFGGMLVILILLIKGVYSFLFLGAPPPVAPLFPGVKTVPGLPIMSFWHWIIAIFILAGVHEFSHGLVSRYYNIKLKSSGFAIFGIFLPILPAAFVEPDEEQLNKTKNETQYGVLAAGSFSNFLAGGIFFLLFLLVLSPLASSMSVSEGVLIRQIDINSPAFGAGIQEEESIIGINNAEVKNVEDFVSNLKGLKEGDKVIIKTKEKSYELEAIKHPEEERGYLGVSVSPEKVYLNEEYGVRGIIISWLSLLVFWVFVANVGVGLFNLLPMGPLDGGKMFYLLALNCVKKEKLAKRIWIGISFFCLALIIISLVPLLSKFWSFIFGIVTTIF